MTSINITYDYDEDYNTNWSNYEWWQKQRSNSNRESLSNDYEKKSMNYDDVFSGCESKSSSKSDLSSVCDDDKRVETWSQTFVKDWIFQTCYEHGLPQPYPVKKFIMNGKGLMLLTKEDFVNRSPECGDILYQRLQKLINTSDSSSPSSTSSFNIGSEFQENKQSATYIPITIETPQPQLQPQPQSQQQDQSQVKQQSQSQQKVQTTYPIVKQETNNKIVEETIVKETKSKNARRRSNSGGSTSSNQSSNSVKNDNHEKKRKKKHSKRKSYYDYELDYLNDMDNNMYDYLKYLNNYFLSSNYNPFSMFNDTPKYGFGIKSTKIVYQSAAKDICMYVNNNSLVVAA